MNPAERKAASREYRETRRPAGIYCVRNTSSGKVLIGSSADLPAMLNRQLSQLRFGGHPNRELQRDWNALGADAFVFEVLDTLTPPDGPAPWDARPDLAVLEALWLERLSPFDEKGYNKRP